MPHTRRRPSIVKETLDTLQAQIRFGESKHLVKKMEKERAEKEGRPWNPAKVTGIFSIKTYQVYKEHCLDFVNWARDKYGVRTLHDARPFVKEYLSECQSKGHSAYTLRTKGAALAKLYGCSSLDFGFKYPNRRRAEITRSRGAAKRDANFSEKNNADLVLFCRATGLRRKELSQVKPEDIYRAANGRVFVHVKEGKGGRPREVPVLWKYNDEVWVLREKAISEGREKMFPKVSSNADIHSYRREYAQALYLETYEKLPLEMEREYYRTRDGLHFERHCLVAVTKALGHNRKDVAVRNYLH